MRRLLQSLAPKTLLQKELGFNLLVSGLVLSLVTGIFLLVQQAAFQRQLTLRAESLATMIARESEFPMLVRNSVELDRLAQSAILGEDVEYAVIVLADGSTTSASRSKKAGGEHGR